MAKERFAKSCKERMLEEVKSCFEKNDNFFITSYMGLTNAELELLRRNLKKTSGDYLVVKNSIIRIVLEKLNRKDMAALVDGGVAVSFSGNDIIATCKTLASFTKEHDKLKIKGAYLEGRMLSADRIKQLASLPAREILLAQAVTGIKAPITGFVNVLGGVIRKFVYVVDAVRSAKERAPQESAGPGAAA